MHLIRPSTTLGSSPLHLTWLPTFDNPLASIPIAILNRGVKAALPVIQDGNRILVHCKSGMHRCVAMACCVLISMGQTANEAMQLVKEKRSVADPDAWYIADGVICLIDNAVNMGIKGYQLAKDIRVDDSLLDVLLLDSRG